MVAGSDFVQYNDRITMILTESFNGDSLFFLIGGHHTIIPLSGCR